MRMVVEAATGPPVILCTTALLAVGMPLPSALAWLLGVRAAPAFTALPPAGAVPVVLRPLVPAVSPVVARRPTCRFVRPLHRLFPDEPGSRRPPAASRGT
ncbi:hypothetical protein AQI84_02925 [Streptomyces griseorubiginosus]|nr:hypothetical protein AQI84_02925 [Streptomyces griseorubiginosus]